MPAVASATDPLALENESQWRLGVMRAFCAGALLPLMPCWTRTNRTTSASHASVLAKLWAQCNFVLWHVVPSDYEPSGSDEDGHSVWSRV